MTSIEEVPVDLLRAISHANKILDWYENLSEKDIPPEWMWGIDSELEVWFEEVKASHSPGGAERDTREEVPMMSNDLAKERKR